MIVHGCELNWSYISYIYIKSRLIRNMIEFDLISNYLEKYKASVKLKLNLPDNKCTV